jgi:LPS sulfotransferase NodH/GT2 family glycosyltransferase
MGTGMGGLQRSYLILTTPRSGSCMLAEALRATGVAGRPEEYFRTELRGSYAREWQLPEPVRADVMLEKILIEGATPNRVFGAKVHWMQFDGLVRLLREAAGGGHGDGARAGLTHQSGGISVAELLSRAFPGLSVVWLQRADQVGQAISWYRALKTDEWWRVKGQRTGPPVSGLALSVRRVATLESYIARANTEIARFVAHQGLQVTPVSYEALAHDLEHTVRDVLNGLGVAPPEVIPPTLLTRQADELSDRWRREYEQWVQEQPAARLTAKPRVETSVVIVSHNEGDYLPATVSRMAETTPRGTEMIVVDDHSTDGSTSGLERLAPDVRVVRPDARLGVAGARNFGARQASGSMLVFSDAHVDPHQGWLSALRRALADPSVGEAAPAIRDLRSRQAAAGYGFTWPDPGMSVRWLRSRPSAPAEVPFICGCFLALRRSDFEALGGFDDGLLTWGSEDAELSLRVWRSGLRCLVVPDAEVSHLFRASFGYPVDQAAVVHNMLRVAAVHFSQPSLRRMLGHWGRHSSFAAAFGRLDFADISARREAITAHSRRDARWFFRRFDMRCWS